MLGKRLKAAITRTLDKIASNPQRYAVVHVDAREALVSGFSYCIYYIVRSSHIDVISVFHTSRNPVEWQSRV